MKFLVIDDEASLLDIWQRMLDSLGAEVLTARNGEEGIALAREQSPDVIITDLRMPVANGFEVLDYVKQLDSNVPMVFVFTAFLEDEENQLRPYPIKRVIRKPFSFSDELEYFRQLIARSTKP